MMMTADEALGQTVRMTMLARNITQAELAPKLGLDQSAVSKKLRGVRPWTFAEFIAVAEELEIDARDLLTRVLYVEQAS